jgi:hypothetical protein
VFKGFSERFVSNVIQIIPLLAVSTEQYYAPLFQCVRNVHGDRGGTVVKVLCYKSEGRWFDSRWCHWNFSLI